MHEWITEHNPLISTNICAKYSTGFLHGVSSSETSDFPAPAGYLVAVDSEDTCRLSISSAEITSVLTLIEQDSVWQAMSEHDIFRQC